MAPQQQQVQVAVPTSQAHPQIPQQLGQAPTQPQAPGGQITAVPAVAVPVTVPATDSSVAGGAPPAKKSRTNTPWTPQEEHRLKQMRDAGNSWAEIAKTFPARTEGSVKKHWYKDMHYAEFAEDEVRKCVRIAQLELIVCRAKL